MATAQEHIDQWKHNRRFARSIDGNYRDWQITAIFYTALHLIDAALDSLDVQVCDHAQRNDQVRTNGSFASVRQQYLDLYRISRVTRYDANPDQWLPAEYLTVADLVNGLLKPIENGVGHLINPRLKFEELKLKD